MSAFLVFCLSQRIVDSHLPSIALGIALGCVLSLNFLQKSFSNLSLLNSSQPPRISSILSISYLSEPVVNAEIEVVFQRPRCQESFLAWSQSQKYTVGLFSLIRLTFVFLRVSVCVQSYPGFSSCLSRTLGWHHHLHLSDTSGLK